MSTRERRRLLGEADTLARPRASLWRVFYRRVKSSGVRMVKAPTEHDALKRVRGGYQARPVLRSSEWRAIYREVGLSRG